jgi:hypothetical protein
MQCFCQLAQGVVNTSDRKIIAAFITVVCDNWCREELGINEPPPSASSICSLTSVHEQRRDGWL